MRTAVSIRRAFACSPASVLMASSTNDPHQPDHATVTSEQALQRFQEILTSAASSDVIKWKWSDLSNARQWAAYVERLGLVKHPTLLLHETLLCNPCSTPRLIALALEAYVAEPHDHDQHGETTTSLEARVALVHKSVQAHTSAWLLLQTLERVEEYSNQSGELSSGRQRTPQESFLAYWNSSRTVAKRACAREMLSVLRELPRAAARHATRDEEHSRNDGMIDGGTSDDADDELGTYLAHIRACANASAEALETVSIAVVIASTEQEPQLARELLAVVPQASLLLSKQRDAFAEPSTTTPAATRTDCTWSMPWL